jgi:hypothetical protein
MLEKHDPGRVLEVGNVLSHYIPVRHDILDKYERGERVINEDIANYSSPKKYELIVSISTLEHVGWDEKPREPLKPLRVLDNMKNMLLPGGRIVLTFSLGYNAVLDDLIKKRRTGFTREYYLKRVTKDNRWKEVGWEDIQNVRYGHPFPYGNGLVIGILEGREHQFRGSASDLPVS